MWQCTQILPNTRSLTRAQVTGSVAGSGRDAVAVDGVQAGSASRM